MKDETIVKYIREELEDNERQEVMRWIASSEEHQKKYNFLKAQHTVSGFNRPALDVEKIYSRWKKHDKKQRQRKILLRLTSAVAIFVLMWFVVDMLPSSDTKKDVVNTKEEKMVEVVTPRGISREIVLPDSTHVVLNVDSRLKYPPVFKDSIREVFLTGEAYFEVIKDTRLPFIVHAGDMNIRVLGTSFNVRSYSGDSDTRTTLVEGTVEVSSDDVAPVKLKPLQAAMLNHGQTQLKIKEVSREEAVSWKEGKLIFKETPLEDVLEDLERRYDVQFEIGSAVLYDYLFTGTFDNLTIDEVLRVLKISSSINYKKGKEKITLY
ncbi:FecR family protein [Sinomicrobium weinanense]|uniref:DUF4974 domain-containing protein n=1 Tax=Sinomicrobium weinanense TaxID=2842200 RepID=A0A926Q389_9FLAO|nr:FecR domain-containing protein [Sinomicrobium weinanense]MBC9797318.1 DUF4974 domain-containing protein [Sinomicrobium weinanense]MBU3122787.1 DUF4974 domain-containing protein [Sinomicrobium weinanense]